MRHKITTTVTHTFDLTEDEQFDHTDHRGERKTRIQAAEVRLVDGDVRIRLLGRRVLKYGELSKVIHNVFLFDPPSEQVLAIVRARGIPVDGAS